MVGRIETPQGMAAGQVLRLQLPLMTCSPLNKAWLPMEEAGGFWVRLRAPFAKKRYAADFKRFQSFVLSFATETRRPLKAGESQAMAEDAVLLRLMDVDAVVSCTRAQPAVFRTVPGYRRRNVPIHFREWLVLHELHLKSRPEARHGRVPPAKGYATV
jgi:hypothetical protein